MAEASINLSAVVPTFLDHQFFDRVVRHSEKDANAKVSKFDIKPASKPGENFASAVFRASITFKSKYAKEDKTVSVIIKTKPVLGPEMADYAAIIENSPFFRNEMAMYGKILPDIQSLLLSSGDEDILTPKLIYQSDEPTSVIVIDDACVDGYTVIDKPPEDLDVSKSIIRRLAKFHAASYFLVSDHKLDCFDFNYNIYSNPATADMLFGKSLEAFTETIKEWDGFGKFVPRFEAFQKNYLSKVLKTYKPNRNEFGFNILNHADFHIRNMLFKKAADGKIGDFLFIDFQICNYATPAIDLVYALYHFTSSANRQKHRDELISCYYNQFVASLKQFGFMKAPPSLIDLQVELLRNGNLEVILAICNVIIYYMDFSKMTAEDFDMGEGTKRAYKRLYNDPVYKPMILKELPRFLYNGFI